MERLYQTYQDIVEFRIVYINEAHATDGDWPVPYAEELMLLEHVDYPHRRHTGRCRGARTVGFQTGVEGSQGMGGGVQGSDRRPNAGYRLG
jgi:hypothetical protein